MENQQTNANKLEIQSESVKEEFYKWFESRGLLGELRAYMRQLMVKALEESSEPAVIRKAATSPKLQAINLLLVDYLFHEDYLYTVSVFASEAQILDSLPQYSRYVTETVHQRRWDPNCMPRFSRQETEDILDTLRLPPSKRDIQQATHLYLSGQESLLTCVARTLASHKVFSHSASVDEVEMSPGVQTAVDQQLWSNEMQNLLLMGGVKFQHIRRMQQKWQLIIEEQKRKSREDSEKDQLRQRKEWEQKLRERFDEERGVEHNILEQREVQLNNLAEQLSELHQETCLRLVQIQKQSDDLQEREVLQERNAQLLEERFCEIQGREENVELTLSRLAKQAPEVKGQPEKTTVQTQTEITMIDESVQVIDLAQHASSCTQTVDVVDHLQQISLPSSADPQLVNLLQMEREKISELQEENLELRAHLLQQRQRIDELTNRASSLTHQLHESQLALSRFHEQDSHLRPILPFTFPPLPPSGGPHIVNSSQRQGAGEESIFTARLFRRDRSPSRFGNNVNHTSEESSPTDELVQNARVRIQQLETESAAVQRSYQSFQTRLLNSPHRAVSNILNPLSRIRRNKIIEPVHQQEARNRVSPDEEESSSDQAILYNPDSMSTTRRLFKQRNLKHYEQWKHFKNKFQRHSVPSYNSRRIYSSSDDDDDKAYRLKHDITKKKNSKKSQLEIFKEQCQHNEFSAKNILADNDLGSQNNVPQNVVNSVNNNNTPPLTIDETSHSKGHKELSPKRKTTEEKLKLEVAQSIKLIESVKELLEAQNLMNPEANSVASSGSLAVESLPKDVDIYTTNSVESKLQAGENLCQSKLKSNEDCPSQDMTGKSLPLDPNLNTGKYQADDTILKYDEMALQGSKTTSVTSASDILRDLNPSKESSDSHLSTGIAFQDSASSGFWN